MKNKPSITYKYYGYDEKEKKLLFPKAIKKISQNLENGYNFHYKVKYVHFKNINFLNNEELIFKADSVDTIVLLEDCHFNCSHISLNECNYILINPTFEIPCEIEVRYAPDIDIALTENNPEIKINVLGCDNFYLESSKNLKMLKILYGSNIHIKNILNNDLEPEIFNSRSLTLENSILKKSNITHTDELILKNSKISTEEDICLDIENLSLENSSLTTKKTIHFKNLKNIDFNDKLDDSILDTSSYIAAEENIIFGENKKLTSKDQPIIITKENYNINYANSRRLLTNVLKEIKTKLENNINQSIEEEKEELLKQLEEKNTKLLTKQIKKLN